MNDVDDLLAQIQQLELAIDQGGTADPAQLTALEAARRAYLDGKPTGDDAAMQSYRLGLMELFQHQKLDNAIPWFRAAADSKGSPIAASARARTSPAAESGTSPLGPAFSACRTRSTTVSPARGRGGAAVRRDAGRGGVGVGWGGGDRQVR